VQTEIDPRDLIGHKAVDRNGDKIGTVDEVYLDDATGEPEWAAVRTGIFGRDAFVPLTTSEFSGEELRVPYDKSLIKESPDFGVGQHLSPAQELQLYRYYGLDAPTGERAAATAPPAQGTAGSRADDLDFGVSAPAAPATGRPMATGPTAPTAGREPSSVGPEAPVEPTIGLDKPVKPAPAPTEPTPEQVRGTAPGQGTAHPARPIELTLREERLEITSEWHVLGTARMRKYVVTEPVERRVQVTRERVRVERVPVSSAEQSALSAQDIAEAVEEVTLREERPVVRKYLAPMERVRLVVERVTEEQVIKDELRRERVEIHDSTGSARPDGTHH
jgi:stress response protein YsnF/sporulation protein YlmC with PRC-barrel domain